MSRRLLILLLFALAILIPKSSVVRAQSAAELFDPNVVQEIRLFINSKDLKILRERYYENTFFPADILWRNVRVRNVAVRSRGFASRNPNKLGLTVDMRHFARGQKFVGLQGLVLDNLWPDPGLIREFVAMRFFERMGQPAPRESFAKLYINNVYQGLYCVVEQIDTDFLARTLGDSSGYLFEYHRLFPWFGDYLGDDLSAYGAGASVPVFDPRTHQHDPDVLIWGPLRDLFREVNQPDDAVWRDRVGQLIDLEAFVRQLAIESFLTENDGLLGPAGWNNFYVYRFGGTSRHRWLVWDKDSTFYLSPEVNTLGYSILERTEMHAFSRHALNYTDLRNIFLQTAEDCARSAAQDNWLSNEVERVLALVSGLAHDDTNKQFPNTDLDQHIDFIRQFARERPGIVLQDLGKLR